MSGLRRGDPRGGEESERTGNAIYMREIMMIISAAALISQEGLRGGGWMRKKDSEQMERKVRKNVDRGCQWTED